MIVISALVLFVAAANCAASKLYSLFFEVLGILFSS